MSSLELGARALLASLVLVEMEGPYPHIHGSRRIGRRKCERVFVPSTAHITVMKFFY
jgi:hypothetical protein